MTNDYYQPLDNTRGRPVNNGQQPAVSSVQQPAVSGQQNADENKESRIKNQVGDSATPGVAPATTPAVPQSNGLNPPVVSPPISTTATSNSQSPADNTDEKEFVEYINETKEKVISDLGFGAATQEQKDHLLETIDKRIMVAVTQAVIENATDEEAQKIRSAIETNGDVEKTVEEIVSKNPALIEKIKAKISELYQKMLDESKGITG